MLELLDFKVVKFEVSTKCYSEKTNIANEWTTNVQITSRTQTSDDRYFVFNLERLEIAPLRLVLNP